MTILEQTQRSFLRALAEGDEAVSNSSSIDPKVFWPVNGFIFFLVIGACVFYCRGGFNFFHSRADSDQTYQQNVIRRREREAERRRGTPEKRKKNLMKSFKRCKVHMVVEESDLILDGPDAVVDVDDEEAGTTGFLMLRETPQDEFTVRRKVPNCCAICLGAYEVGEEVVWSSNEECQHAFHMDCLVDWLTKMRDGTPCPCCRAEFTDLEKVRKEDRITWRAGSTFNPSAVSL
mmetsp:Transcript_16877/g.34866  ORF Transcript_16877/g.34866 Transcript_16877/m.34866 type:complete len:233 (-) Transcript_16877:26-724(-)